MVKVSVPVGTIEVGAALDGLVALAAEVSAAVTETELSDVAEATLDVAPLDGCTVKVAELVPTGTTVVDWDAVLASEVADSDEAVVSVADAAVSVDVCEPVASEAVDSVNVSELAVSVVEAVSDDTYEDTYELADEPPVDRGTLAEELRVTVAPVVRGIDVEIVEPAVAL